MLKQYKVTVSKGNGTYNFIVKAKNYREAADEAENKLGDQYEDQIVNITVNHK